MFEVFDDVTRLRHRDPGVLVDDRGDAPLARNALDDVSVGVHRLDEAGLVREVEIFEHPDDALAERARLKSVQRDLWVRFAHTLSTRESLLSASLAEPCYGVGTGTAGDELSYPRLKPWDSAWTPVLAEISAGDSYSPLTFIIPLFKRTPKGAPSSPPVWLRRRYRKPMFFVAS